MIFTLAATIAATMLAVTRERDAITICLCMGKKKKSESEYERSFNYLAGHQ